MTAVEFAPLANTMIKVVTDYVTAYASQVDDGAYPALDATIDVHAAGMDHLVHESESLGVNAELPRFVASLAQRAVVDGHGGDSYAAVVRAVPEAGSVTRAGHGSAVTGWPPFRPLGLEYAAAGSGLAQA